MSKQKIHELYEKIDYLESELDIALFEVKHQRNDIKRFLLLLIENDIPIPEDLINKYINKAHKIKQNVKLPFWEVTPHKQILCGVLFIKKNK